MTVHEAQGATCDLALLWGSDDLYAEAGYTALTRGRLQNRVFVLEASGGHEHLPPERRDPAAQIAARLAVTTRRPAALEPPGLVRAPSIE